MREIKKELEIRRISHLVRRIEGLSSMARFGSIHAAADITRNFRKERVCDLDPGYFFISDRAPGIVKISRIINTTDFGKELNFNSRILS